MRKIIIALVATLATSLAFAADSGCEAKALSKDGKPLAGAAKNAFIKKCEADAKGGAAPAAKASDAKAACEAKALSKDGKPLAGAAKNASVKKCMAESK